MKKHLLSSAALRALVVPAVAMAAFAPSALMAQETTSIVRGTVTSGDLAVAGAAVTLTDVDTGTRATSTTGANGNFSFPGLRPGGPYTLEVRSAQGSKTITDIFTIVQQTYVVPVELAPAADAASDIVVTAARVTGAGTRSDGPQTVLTQRDVSKVASVNRDIRDIQRRDPFATLDLSNSGDRGGAVSFAGVNPRFNRFTINGVTVGDTFGLNQDASPTNRGPVPFDAIGQVSVSIAPYDFRQSGFQGGAIDTVLLSGTNEFHGTGFYSQNTDGLSGDRIGSTTIVTPRYKSETYAATIRGPIIKDKLFFMISGERNTDPRPFSTLLPQVPNLSQATVDGITTTAKNLYNIDAGSVLTINPRKDEKIAARIDWNVTDGQQFSLSYINAFDSLVSQNNTSTSSSSPQYGLSTNAYALTELVRAGIAQLNSQWTDRFSSEARFIYRRTVRGQEPLGGRPNGQLQVCTDATSVGSATGCSTGVPRVTFGPDNFRQTNQLNFDTYEGSLLLRYAAGQHDVKMLFDLTRNRTFNNFVPNSLGAFYFDSLADYQARRANTFQYAATLDGQPNSAAAAFNYTQYAAGLQDDWKISDALQVSLGARLSLYSQDQAPVLNPFFTNRYGFSNLKTYKGLTVFEPRASFNYKPIPAIRIKGGAGIFAGGSPDIYLSNSFSNTITTNAIFLTRDATCNTPGTICDLALNNVTGNVPAAVAAFTGTATTPALLARTNTGALAPDFQIPRSLKATLSADYTFRGIDFGLDYYYSENIKSVIFTDARSIQVGVLPDGRPRYTGLIANNDNNYDILVSNSSQGRSHIGVIRASKNFDFGLSLFGSYTLQSVRDVSSATSSTINSNYRNQLFADPNFPAYGTSADETKWQFKYSVGYDHAFFGDYRTVFQLFGETRAGRHFSYTFTDPTTARSPVFGTNLNSSVGTNLLYVPLGTTDPRVAYDSTITANALDAFINANGLSRYRGQIIPKNTARSRAFTRIDLHLEQEIPTFVGRSRFTLFADINNLPNLINRNWGGLRQLGFPYGASLVQVACQSVAGTPLTGGVGSATNPAAGCAQYRYSNFTTPNDSVVNVTQSLYQIRIGARFTF